MVQPRKSNVQSQHHAQHELIHGHRSGYALHSEGILDQLLKLELLQHRRHRQQATVGRQILPLEVKMCGSVDSYRLWGILCDPSATPCLAAFFALRSLALITIWVTS